MIQSPSKIEAEEAAQRVRNDLLRGAGGLSQRARRLFRWRAVVQWLTVVLAVFGLLIAADAIFRYEEIGLRILAWLCLFAAAGYGAYRTLFRAWKFNPTPVQIARWVEQTRPEASGVGLTSAVEIAEIPLEENRYGSATFRTSALQKWASEGFHPTWNAYLDTASWWKAAFWLGFVIVLMSGCALLWPQEAWLGLGRLSAPWAALPWPRADRLQLHNPPVAAAVGSQIQVEVIDAQPPLPESIEILLRPAAADTAPVTRISTTPVGDIAVGSLPTLESAIDVRAVGGEDQTMPWHRIEVVQPPLVDTFRFLTTTPDYAGGESAEIVGKRISVLAGSSISLVGHLSMPVKSLSMQLFTSTSPGSDADEKSAPGSGSPAGSGWSIQLDRNSQDFVVEDASGGPWIASKSISWQFRVTTKDDLQLTLPGLWAIEVTPDAAPVVLLREPGLRDISTTASIHLNGRATDDLGLVRVAAYGQLGRFFENETKLSTRSNEEPVELLIWGADDVAFGTENSVREKAVDTRWSLLDKLQSALPAGAADFEDREALEDQEVTVWIEATDTRGQIGRSQPRVFMIRSREQVLAALEEQQRRVLEQLRELTESQRKNSQLAARNSEVIAQSGEADQQSADALASISQIQSTIGRRLSSGPTSLQASIEALIAQYEMNDLSATQSLLELETWRQGIARIASDPMPAAVQAAYSAQQVVSGTVAASSGEWVNIDDEQQSRLAKSATAQAEVTLQLQALLDQASRAEAAQQVQSELRSILQEQRQYQLDTRAYQLRSLERDDRDRNAAERVALASDQQGMARRLDRLVERIRETTSTAEESSSRFRGVGDAADYVTEKQAGNLMRRSADQIRSQEFADAIQSQQETIEILEEALRQTRGSADSASASLAQQASELRQSSQAVRELAEQQAALAERIVKAEARQLAELLAQEQAGLKQNTSQQAMELDSTENSKASQALEDAVESQETALRQLEQGSSTSAAQPARQAAEQLTQAARQLSDLSQQLERSIQQQQVFQLSASVEKLVAGQRLVVEELLSLAERLDDSQEPDPEQAAGAIAAAQDSSLHGLSEVRRRVSELPAFDWAFEQIAADMARTVAASQRLRISPEALNAAQAAYRRLQIVNDAIQSTGDELQQASSGPSNANDPPEPQQRNQRLIPPIASLKLLRGLQLQVNEQTQAVDRLDVPTPRRRQLSEELSAQQQQLGERLRQLMLELEARQ